jgi:Tol biopolymer transport system component
MRQLLLAAATAAALAALPAAATAQVAERLTFLTDRDGQYDVWSMAPDGSDERRLTSDPADDEEAAGSPDGSRIAFVSDRDGDAEIFTMDARGGDVVQLTRNSHADFAPVWSPDGRRIAFTSDRDTPAQDPLDAALGRPAPPLNLELYVMNADGSGQTNVSRHAALDSYPTWSPDARRIMFGSTRDGGSDLYVMDADGGDAQRLTETADRDEFFPRWSPDGRNVVYSLREEPTDHSYELWTARADGSEQRRIVGPGRNYDPTWTLDGSQVMWGGASPAGDLDVFFVRPDGSSLRSLARPGTNESQPAPLGVPASDDGRPPPVAGELHVAVRPRRARVGRRTAFRFSVTQVVEGRRVPAPGARVTFAGGRRTTDARGRATIVRRLRLARRYRAHARKAGLRAGAATVVARRR